MMSGGWTLPPRSGGPVGEQCPQRSSVGDPSHSEIPSSLVGVHVVALFTEHSVLFCPEFQLWFGESQLVRSSTCFPMNSRESVTLFKATVLSLTVVSTDWSRLGDFFLQLLNSFNDRQQEWIRIARPRSVSLFFYLVSSKFLGKTPRMILDWVVHPWVPDGFPKICVHMCAPYWCPTHTQRGPTSWSVPGC